MALTPELQAQLEFQTAIQQLNATRELEIRAHEKEMEALRHANNSATAKSNADSQAAIVAKQTKIEAIRIAQQTLVENRRNQPVDSREITAADIQAFAQSIIAYVNS